MTAQLAVFLVGIGLMLPTIIFVFLMSVAVLALQFNLNCGQIGLQGGINT